MKTQIDDDKLEALIETVMNLTCEYALADIVDALAFHCRATSEGAESKASREAWESAADVLDEAIEVVANAEAET